SRADLPDDRYESPVPIVFGRLYLSRRFFRHGTRGNPGPLERSLDRQSLKNRTIRAARSEQGDQAHVEYQQRLFGQSSGGFWSRTGTTDLAGNQVPQHHEGNEFANDQGGRGIAELGYP